MRTEGGGGRFQGIISVIAGFEKAVRLSTMLRFISALPFLRSSRLLLLIGASI